MTTVRTCWAFNKDMQRCDMPAGHPGNHSITATWTDEECYLLNTQTHYTQTSNPTTITAPATPVTHIEPAPRPTPTPEPCAACRHMHKAGECKCGCYTHIG